MIKIAVTKIWAVAYPLDRAISYASNPDKTIGSIEEIERLEKKRRQFVEKNQEALQAVINYAMNEKKTKTEEVKFVSGINCNGESCYYEMSTLKQKYHKEDKIQAYHSYQSFPEGEVNAELCHQIGVETAKRMWGETAQVVVATHLNTDHLHNHFVINSVALDGHKLAGNEKNYYRLKAISDEVCKEYGLSLVDIKQKSEDKNTKEKQIKSSNQVYKNNTERKKGKPTVRSQVKADVDRIIEQSNSFSDFIRLMRKEGYTVKTQVKHIAVRPLGKDRFIRLRSLGDDYTAEKIAERIISRKYPNEKLSRTIPSDMNAKKRTAHYRPQGKCYRVYGFRASIYIKTVRISQTYIPTSWQGKTLKEIQEQEEKELTSFSKQSFYLTDNKIKTLRELKDKREDNVGKLSKLNIELDELREELKVSEDDTRIEQIVKRTSAVKKEIANLKADIKTIDEIENRWKKIQKLDKERNEESIKAKRIAEEKTIQQKSGTDTAFRKEK